MSQAPRKKLLVISQQGAIAPDILDQLASLFDIETATPDQACRPSGLSPFDAALIGSDHLEKLAACTSASCLLDSIGVGTCLVSLSGEPIWANTRFSTYSDPAKNRIFEMAEQAGADFAKEDHSLPSIGVRTREIASTTSDRIYEATFSPAFFSDDPTPAAVAVYISEVTEERRNQQKIEAIDRAGRELMRLDADSVKQMNPAERLGLLEDRIVQCAHELLHFDHFTIRLLDADSSRLGSVISTGLPQAALDLELHAGAENNGIIGHVAATGRSYVCPDVAADPLYIQGLDHAGSSLTTPLLLHDKVIGVFNAESDQINAFTPQDLRFAEILARYVAMSIHMLDLLVVEQSTTNIKVSGRFEGEMEEPLDDLFYQAEWLEQQPGVNPETKKHIELILRDVDAIRKRVHSVAQGHKTILGAQRALREEGIDPLFKGKRVLVADDEPDIRNTINDVLKGRGCTVTVTTNGQEAIDALHAAVAEGAPIDLVISDINMPDRNGYEVFSTAKSLSDNAPVILMTGFGYDPHHSIVRASQAGLQCVLFKPFQIERLLEEVRKTFSIAEPDPS